MSTNVITVINPLDLLHQCTLIGKKLIQLKSLQAIIQILLKNPNLMKSMKKEKRINKYKPIKKGTAQLKFAC